MFWFNVVMLTCAAVISLLLFAFMRSSRFNAPTAYLESTPNGVIVRQYPIDRLLASKGQRVAVDSVNKVQVSEGVISVFRHSGAAYDMWVLRRFENELCTHAMKMFPNAELVRV